MAYLSAPLSVSRGSASSFDVPVHTGEIARLDECVQERIHTPGAVQPHGALVAVDLERFTITHASSNTRELFGIDAASLIGTELSALVGPPALASLRNVLDWDAYGDNPTPLVVNGARFDGIVHLSGDQAVVEFEPEPTFDAEHSAPAIYAAILRLAGAIGADDLYAWTARELRRLTQFDRVVVYRFHPDDHGEVVAEEVAEGLEPYLGLHFPASDIPIQARRLYLTKRARVIVTSEDGNADIVSSGPTDAPLDLSRAELRGISPSHLTFMRNMGQVSTMSFSLVHNGELLGMITCAHRTPKRIPYVLRQGYEILANQVALQLGSMAEVEWLTRLHEVRAARAALTRQIAATDDISHALTGMAVTILDVVDAEGAVLRVNGKVTLIGSAPSSERVDEAFGRLHGQTNGLPFLTEALEADRPDLGVLLPGFSGVMMVPFGSDNYIAWFRPEIARVVNWLGDQRFENRATPLSPRNSFSAWQESVAGMSTPWGDWELVEAGELCRELNFELARRDRT